jgi:hypothetical protein
MDLIIFVLRKKILIINIYQADHDEVIHVIHHSLSRVVVPATLDSISIVTQIILRPLSALSLDEGLNSPCDKNASAAL